MTTGNLDVGIVDIGIGNVRSVENALRRVECVPHVLRAPDELKPNFTHLILPGVGNFHRGMKLITENFWDEALRQAYGSGSAILGICLGFQLFASSSSESAHTLGLGLLESPVSALEPSTSTKPPAQVPHMGFNSLELNGVSTLMKDIPKGSDFYFTHSFAFHASDFQDRGTLGMTQHGENYMVSLFENSNLMGVQFHPEKSGGAGLQLLKNFVEKC